jgi:hypothetical protein
LPPRPPPPTLLACRSEGSRSQGLWAPVNPGIDKQNRGIDSMIIRRYGARFHSVSLNFDPAAMTEVGFRKDGAQDWDAEEFLMDYEMVREEEIIAEASDGVQEEAERAMLNSLKQKVNGVLAGLEEGHFLSVESRVGVDYPRTRYCRPKTGDLEFTYTLDKPLRLGIWVKK